MDDIRAIPLEVQDALRAVRAFAESMAVAVRTGPAQRATENGVPYVAFSRGTRHAEGAEDPPFIGPIGALVHATNEAVKAYRDEIGGRVVLAWREFPQYEAYGTQGATIWLRLAFEPIVETPIPSPTTGEFPRVGAVVDIDAPNIALVHRLEELLAKAVDGEIRAVAIVTVKRGGFVGTEWLGAEDGHLHTLNSGAAVLAHRLCKDCAP